MTEAIDLNALSAKQCECLELVLQHMTSKQIALELGISPFTVNQRLDAARRRLGAATRYDAAIIYAKLKGIPQSLAYHALTNRESGPSNAANAYGLPDHLSREPFMLGNRQLEELIDSISEEDPTLTFSEAPFDAFSEKGPAPLSEWIGIGSEHSKLVLRLFLVFGIAIAIMVMIIVAVAAGQGLTKMLHSA